MKTLVHLQRCVKDDQFRAGWYGIIAAVVHEELGVDVFVRISSRLCGKKAVEENPAAGLSVWLYIQKSNIVFMTEWL